MPAAGELHRPARGTARLAGAFLVAASACTSAHYALPMTAGQLAEGRDGGALVAYLGQPDASAVACEAGAPGARLAADAGTRRALFRAFGEGRIPPGTWRHCLDALLRSAPPDVAGDILDDALAWMAAALDDPALETDGTAQERLEALLHLYREREAGAPGAGAARRAAAALRRGFEGGPEPTSSDEAGRASERRPLGPIALRRAEELLAALELEDGRWQGRPVAAAALDALLEAGDEPSLRLWADRVGDPSLRAEARRRLVRLRVRTSPFPEVRRDAAAVEEAVLRAGSNPVALAQHSPLGGRLDPARFPERQAVVEQRVEEQTARVLGEAAGRAGASVFPEVPLRGALWVRLRGLSGEVTVCAPARELEVSPCVAPGDLSASGPLARVDGDGVLRLADALAEPAVVELARREARLRVDLAAGGLRLASLDWPLAFRATGDLVLAGGEPGGRGPDLAVSVDRSRASRLFYDVAAPGRRYQAVVEWSGAAAFRVLSRGGAGARGASGWRGSDGSPGASGASASCPSSPGQDGQRGGDGGAGGAGGPGGPGGRGGDVRVTVVASPTLRAETIGLVARTVLSQGGPGGPGGSGGRGGSGGSGGSGGLGTTCWDSDGRAASLQGGNSGPSGASGLDGPDGPDGPAGAPGRVILPAS